MFVGDLSQGHGLLKIGNFVYANAGCFESVLCGGINVIYFYLS